MYFLYINVSVVHSTEKTILVYIREFFAGGRAAVPRGTVENAAGAGSLSALWS